MEEEKAAQTLQLKVKNLQGQIIEVEIDAQVPYNCLTRFSSPQKNVSELKEKISAQINESVDRIRLIHKAKRMEND